MTCIGLVYVQTNDTLDFTSKPQVMQGSNKSIKLHRGKYASIVARCTHLRRRIHLHEVFILKSCIKVQARCDAICMKCQSGLNE